MSDEDSSELPTTSEHGTQPLPLASFDDPHLSHATHHPVRTERLIALFLFMGMCAVAAFGGAYWENATPWILGATLGVGLVFIGFGLTAWGKYLMPQGPFVEDRHPLASSSEARTAMAAALVERTGVVVKRRRMLGGLLGGGLGIFGIVAIFPLLRSLGPVPGDTLEKTDWKRGTYLVDLTGRRVHVSTLAVGGYVSVYPEGKQTTTTAQSVDMAMLIRLGPEAYEATPNTAFRTGPYGYVCYSKLCTHLGCPVGLYEKQLQLIVCPCHQSMFAANNAATPTFGPAPRPLPELPLMVDRQGYFRAAAPFDQAVGPGFWERTTARTLPKRSNG